MTYPNASGVLVHPLGYMVAELWQSEGEIASHGYGSTSNPALASAFDFPLRYRLVQTLATQEDTSAWNATRQPATNLEQGLAAHSAYPDHAMPNLMIGNHACALR